jgi:hypothetical protein
MTATFIPARDHVCVQSIPGNEPYVTAKEQWILDNTNGKAGLIVLSSALHPVFMNEQASELLHLSDQTPSYWGHLPEVLREVGVEVIDFLKMRLHAGDHRSVNLMRLAGESLYLDGNR